MTVLIPESCWNSCSPQPTKSALLTVGVRIIFMNTLEPGEVQGYLCFFINNME